MNRETDMREFSRSRVRLRIEIETGEFGNISGHTRDVSMRGVYVCTGRRPAVGSRCKLRLALGEFPHETRLVASGFVVRTDGGGFGVQFGEMDLDSYHHLQSLVLNNAIDPDETEVEFGRHTGLGPA